MNQWWVYIFPLPLEPPESNPLGCHRAPGLRSLSHIASSHWLSVLHVVMHMFPCHSLSLFHPLLLLCVHKSALYVCISTAALKILWTMYLFNPLALPWMNGHWKPRRLPPMKHEMLMNFKHKHILYVHVYTYLYTHTNTNTNIYINTNMKEKEVKFSNSFLGVSMTRCSWHCY